MFDWTTHAVNLAKGIADKKERYQQAQCNLCGLRCVENQVYNSIMCKNRDLIYVRGIYKKEIESMLTTFNRIKLPKKELHGSRI